ncbi:MAG: pyridoxal phosphate-dependent aminotransferase family protein, partial [Planctomycetales bacterium]|nr:pyridoxal phosphate-dependent aminotransferase family protein [Planctomycetales bacterium]
YACGSSPLIEYLVSHCRSYLFSTASPGASLAAAHAALRLLRQRGDARQGLRQSARALRSQLAALGLDVPPGDSPILPVILGSEERVLTISQQLAERAIYVPAIRPPTVPRGTARLRISLSTRHTGEQIEQLLTALRQAL